MGKGNSSSMLFMLSALFVMCVLVILLERDALGEGLGARKVVNAVLRVTVLVKELFSLGLVFVQKGEQVWRQV